MRIKKLDDAPKLGTQPEEEKMIKIMDLINKINVGPLNKNYKTQDIDGKPCFISNNYINKFKNETKTDENDTKYKINDAFGTNKINLSKSNVDKDSKPGDYVLIKNKKDNKNYLVDLKDLLNNLHKFKSIDNDITLNSSVDNKPMTLNPFDIEIVPPSNDYPLEKTLAKKIIVPEKKAEDIININKEKEKEKEKEEDRKDRRGPENDKDKEGIKERIRLRSAPAKNRAPEKKSYKIRRAIIYKRQKK